MVRMRTDKGEGHHPPPNLGIDHVFNGKPLCVTQGIAPRKIFVARRQGLIDQRGVNAFEKMCAVNFEIHTSGFHEIWETLYGGSLTGPNVEEINEALTGFAANQYGRTLFHVSRRAGTKASSLLPGTYRMTGYRFMTRCMGQACIRNTCR